MSGRLPLLLLLALTLPWLVFLRSECPALAQTATISFDGDFVPVGGLRDTGVTLTAPVSATDTVLSISDATPLKTGLTLELSYGELMEITALSGDGPGGVSDEMTVNRGVGGTGATTHPVGSHVWADFTQIDVLANDVEHQVTGATLATAASSNLFESSGALLTEAVGTTETTLKVSDASLVPAGLLGSGQLTIQVDSEKMRVFSATPGIATNSGVTLEEDVTGEELTVWAERQTVIAVSDSTKLQVGWLASIPEDGSVGETVLIVGLAGDGAGGGQDTMTVVRDQTFHPMTAGTPIYAGADRITVQRHVDGTAAASHSTGADIHVDLRVFDVSDQNLLGRGSTIQIDGEKLLISELPASFVHATAATLATSANSGATFLRVSDATVEGFEPKGIARIESEYMAIRDVAPGCAVALGAIVEEAVDASEQWLDINDYSLLGGVHCTITIGSEELLVTEFGEDVDGPGAVQDTMKVVRGYADSTPATHISGSAISSGDEIIHVARGLYGTSAASHGAGKSVSALFPGQDTMKVIRGLDGTSPQSHAAGASIIDVDGLGAYGLELSTPIPDTGVALTASIDDVTTSIPISSAAPLEVGWTAVIDDEKVLITQLDSTSMTVKRGRDGTGADSHDSGAPVRAPVFVDYIWAGDGPLLGSSGRAINCHHPVSGLDNVKLECATPQGGSPLGPTGSGVLAEVAVSSRALVSGGSRQPLTYSATVLLDVSGDLIPHGGSAATIKVVRCPDFDGDRSVTFSGDLIGIAEAYFLPDVPELPEHDIDLDGSLTFSGDLMGTAMLYFVSRPQPLRCVQ